MVVNPMATAGPPRGNQLGRRDVDDASILLLRCYTAIKLSGTLLITIEDTLLSLSISHCAHGLLLTLVAQHSREQLIDHLRKVFLAEKSIYR
jgi:hypothetical protein